MPAYYNIVMWGLLCALTSGCGAFDFEVDRYLNEVTVETSDGSVWVPEEIIPSQQWNEELPGIPEGVFLERMTLLVTTPELDEFQHFGFVHSVAFFAQPLNEGTGLPRVLIAWADQPGAVPTISLQVNRALNLLPYVQAGFEVVSEVQGESPLGTVRFGGHAVLGIDAI